jgi:mannosyltransferase OCH1-like enzyme
MNNKKMISVEESRFSILGEYHAIPRIESAIIPLKLHLFWHDKVLPPRMNLNVEFLKIVNPEFNVVVYDATMARDYIKKYFSEEILQTYDKLIPLTFKRDLFCYCVVYNEGGIYLDIKLEPINRFKLLHLVKHREVWATENIGVANTKIFMSVPGSPILKHAIDMIKSNVENRRMGEWPSSVTGSWLLTDTFLSIGKNDARIFDNHVFKLRVVLKQNLVVDPKKMLDNKVYITINGSGRKINADCLILCIFGYYKGYQEELKCKTPHFHSDRLWYSGKKYIFADADADADSIKNIYFTKCGGDGYDDNCLHSFSYTDSDDGGLGNDNEGSSAWGDDSGGGGDGGDGGDDSCICDNSDEEDDSKYNKYNEEDRIGMISTTENSVIPLKLHLFWHDKTLPPKMQENVETLKKINPEFDVIVYDGEAAYEYIKNNFPGDVLKAYDILIPISFKSDLFRFCVVYKEGGVYLDIKFEPIDGFKLLNLVKYREVWATECENIVNTGIFMSVPKNRILKCAIDMIKYNALNRIMGAYASSITGPWLLTDAVTSIGKEGYGADADVSIFDNPMFKLRLILKSCNVIDPNKDGHNKIYFTKSGSGRLSNDECILFPIYKFYKGYREELKNLSPQLHWTKMWEMGPDFVFDITM